MGACPCLSAHRGLTSLSFPSLPPSFPPPLSCRNVIGDDLTLNTFGSTTGSGYDVEMSVTDSSSFPVSLVGSSNSMGFAHMSLFQNPVATVDAGIFVVPSRCAGKLTQCKAAQ